MTPAQRIKNPLEHLLNYQQADEDGIMVLVSRQAIHEVAADLEALLSQHAEMLEALEWLRSDIIRGEVVEYDTLNDADKKISALINKIKAEGKEQ